MEVPIYGPVTNGTETGLLGTGLLGTVATTIAGSHNYKSNPLKGYISVDVDASYYSQDIETLKEENEALKAKVELLEIQFKFALNKLTEMEKIMESRK